MFVGRRGGVSIKSCALKTPTGWFSFVTINNEAWRRKEISETVQLYRRAGFTVESKSPKEIVMQKDS